MTTLPARSAGAHRLTDVERAEREVTGGELQDQITDLAELLGWSWLHIRPGLRANGRWYVPVQGPLGAGWPDLVLTRPRDRRLIFAELKRQLGDRVTDDQAFVLEQFGQLETQRGLCGEGPHGAPSTWPDGIEPRLACCPLWLQTFVWRPSDLRDPIETSRIYEVLR